MRKLVTDNCVHLSPGPVFSWWLRRVGGRGHWNCMYFFAGIVVGKFKCRKI